MVKTAKPYQKAWVVFSGQTDLPWLKILKEGYRHCYIILNDGHHWITIDPLSSYMDVSVPDLPSDFNLPLWMKNSGQTVLPAQIRHIDKQAPWMLFSCVEAVKRVPGIHKRWIITPWQLYRHLQQEQNARLFTNIKNKPEKGDFAWEA